MKKAFINVWIGFLLYLVWTGEAMAVHRHS